MSKYTVARKPGCPSLAIREDAKAKRGAAKEAELAAKERVETLRRKLLDVPEMREALAT